ncbi:phage gp6-like head-tail connector protein [Agrobacterium rhizogenes]|nr:phage gp6-like head-tail connector protein [Rhizobium rhizogenes]NTF75123.1 phage gp6-like head-tail connector protein [Rhizobium rhizogenes]NTH51517.1 phage gp6-like head-tail connector protein [Rhizobium rhizogenes]NTH71101.1 phage gp6-like head-tail connector protein [Rhizobium rhizogenes]
MPDPIDLVTLAAAKRRLRILHDDEDESIQDMVTEASAAIRDYVKLSDEEWGALSDVRQHSARLAALNLVKWLYNDRDGSLGVKVASGYLPESCTMFLHRLRMPALA